MLINKHYQHKSYKQKKSHEIIKNMASLKQNNFIETESNLGIAQSIKCKYIHFFYTASQIVKQVLRLVQI